MKLSKFFNVRQTSVSKHYRSDIDRLYALLRRYSRRVETLETKLSVLRRDTDRVEKKLSRAGVTLGSNGNETVQPTKYIGGIAL